MLPLISRLVLVCIVAAAVLALVDFARARAHGRLVLEIGCLVLVAWALRVTTGFPRSAVRQPFGSGNSQLLMIALMFLCILLGMAARYVFFLKGHFGWLAFLRPLCVSPIVLLPLLGTLETSAALEPVQVVSFCILAFQNGFFWRVIFERAQTRLAG